MLPATVAGEKRGAEGKGRIKKAKTIAESSDDFLANFLNLKTYFKYIISRILFQRCFCCTSIYIRYSLGSRLIKIFIDENNTLATQYIYPHISVYKNN